MSNSRRITTLAMGITLIAAGAQAQEPTSVEGVIRSMQPAPETLITQGAESLLNEARSELAAALVTIGGSLTQVQIDIAACELTRQQRSPEVLPSQALQEYQACLGPQARVAADLSRSQQTALGNFAATLSVAKGLIQDDQQRLIAQQRDATEELDKATRDLAAIQTELATMQENLGASEQDLSFVDSQILVRTVDDSQRTLRRMQRRAGELGYLVAQANNLEQSISALNEVDVLLATKQYIAGNEAVEYEDIADSIGRGPLSFGSTADLELDTVIDILNGIAGGVPMPGLYPIDEGATTARVTPVDDLPITILTADEARELIAAALRSGAGGDQ
jgi:hypothetical protein